MKLYCLVKNLEDSEGNISREIAEGPIELPTNTYHISNLNIMSDTALKEFGWLPYEKKSDGKEVCISSRFEILEDRVIEFVTTRDKTIEEKTVEKETADIERWLTLRHKRDQLLAASDRMVVVDRWEKMTLEERERIARYRQALRDLPGTVIDPEVVGFPVF